MRYVIATVGSAGDVFPAARIAGELAAQGHTVSVIAPPPYEDTIRALDRVEFIPLASREGYAESMRWKFMLWGQYYAVYYAKYCVEWNQTIFNHVRTRIAPDLVMLGFERPNFWADTSARALFGVPVIRLVTDLPPAFGRPTNTSRVQTHYANLVEIRWRQWLQGLGLSAGPNPIARAARHGGGAIPRYGLWPQWLVGKAPTFAAIKAVGFVANAQNTPTEPTVPTAEKRITFVTGTDGTVTDWAPQFQAMASQACRAISVPGLLLGDGGAVTPSDQWLVYQRSAPFAETLHCTTAIVHHGGIGTAAAALERGIPQIILPRVFAQRSNAEWLRRAGVACVLDANRVGPNELAAALRWVISNIALRTHVEKCAKMKPLRVDVTSLCHAITTSAKRLIADRISTC